MLKSVLAKLEVQGHFFKARDIIKPKKKSKTNESLYSITQPKHGSHIHDMEWAKSKHQVSFLLLESEERCCYQTRDPHQNFNSSFDKREQSRAGRMAAQRQTRSLRESWGLWHFPFHTASPHKVLAFSHLTSNRAYISSGNRFYWSSQLLI